MKSSHREPEVKSCGFLVFRNQPDFSFLLMKHLDRWDLPKGHVDPGETDVQTAYRELREETGIRRKQIELDADFRFNQFYTVQKKRYGKKPRLKELVIYLGLLNTDVSLELTEHIGFEWLPWAPPHSIQEKTIDPLLKAVEQHWSNGKPAWRAK